MLKIQSFVDTDTTSNMSMTFLVTTCMLFLVYCFIDTAGSTLSDINVTVAIQQIEDLAIECLDLKQIMALKMSLLTSSLNMNFTDLVEHFQQNFTCLHLIIYHTVKQYIFVVTFNIDLSITVHLQECIDSTTDNLQLQSIYARLNRGIPVILDRTGISNIKLTIFTIGSAGRVGDLFTTTCPLFPFSDLLASCTWSLLVHVYGIPDIFLYLRDVGNNINIVSSFLDFLIEKGYDYFDMPALAVNDEIAEDLWSDLKAINQAIRYVETIHNIYTPINRINTTFSSIMEEI